MFGSLSDKRSRLGARHTQGASGLRGRTGVRPMPANASAGGDLGDPYAPGFLAWGRVGYWGIRLIGFPSLRSAGNTIPGVVASVSRALAVVNAEQAASHSNAAGFVRRNRPREPLAAHLLDQLRFAARVVLVWSAQGLLFWRHSRPTAARHPLSTAQPGHGRRSCPSRRRLKGGHKNSSWRRRTRRKFGRLHLANRHPLVLHGLYISAKATCIALSQYNPLSSVD